jgi:hypothetical protein
VLGPDVTQFSMDVVAHSTGDARTGNKEPFREKAAHQGDGCRASDLVLDVGV